MGLDLCRASHVKRPCAILCLVGGRQIPIPLTPRVFFLPHSGFSPLRLSHCASAFDSWVEVGGFGCRPLWGGVTRVHPRNLMRGTFMVPRVRVHRKHAIFRLARHGSRSVPGFPRKTALCHTLPGGRQTNTYTPRGFFLPHSGFSPLRLSHCASAFDSWVEVGGFGCRPLWGGVIRVHPRSLMRGTFMAPRMRIHRKHAIFELARHGSRSVPGFPRKTALCHTLPGGRQTNTYTPSGFLFAPQWFLSTSA